MTDRLGPLVGAADCNSRRSTSCPGRTRRPTFDSPMRRRLGSAATSERPLSFDEKHPPLRTAHDALSQVRDMNLVAGREGHSLVLGAPIASAHGGRSRVESGTRNWPRPSRSPRQLWQPPVDLIMMAPTRASDRWKAIGTSAPRRGRSTSRLHPASSGIAGQSALFHGCETRPSRYQWRAVAPLVEVRGRQGVGGKLRAVFSIGQSAQRTCAAFPMPCGGR